MVQQGNQAEMFFRSQNQATKTYAMVYALAHVVPKGKAVGNDYGANNITGYQISYGFGLSTSSADSPSGSGPGLCIGKKRGREDETSTNLIESAPRVQRSFADFRSSQADSSSAATTSVAEETTTSIVASSAAAYEEIDERRRRYISVRQRP